MTNCPFVKIITDMRRNHIHQRDQQPDWCWDNVLLDNKIETTHNKLAIFVDSNRKIFVAKSPTNWSARYLIKFFHIDDIAAKINDNEDFTLDSLNITVYDDKNSSRTIPPICQQELNRDVTQWLQEARYSKLNDYLPTLSSSTGEEKAGKVIKINCYYEALFQYNDGDTNYICCRPTFLKRGPRYNFVL